MNLRENNPVASYTRALAKFDRMMCWNWIDDGGTPTTRLVGIPITEGPRLVRATEAAGAATNITCNVIHNDETEAASGELGYNIEVYANICGGGNLNTAVPRIENDNYLMAECVQGKWYFTTTFNKSQDC